MFKRSNKDKGYRLRKSGLKEKFIDRQILAIHRAIVEKLIISPHLHQGVFDTIEARKKEGRLGYGAYLTWFCLMEDIDNHDAFRKGVLEDSPRMNKLRRRTPFVGILTEEERQQALDNNACGNTSIDTIY